MAEIPDSIKETVRKYIDALEKNNIRIRKAFLFGSYANGNYNKWSDIDIALVSDSFKGDRYDDRKKIARVTIDTDCRIERMPFSTSDFDETNLFVKQIVKTGISLV